MTAPGISASVKLSFLYAIGDEPVLDGIPCRITGCFFRSKGGHRQILHPAPFPNCALGHRYYVAKTPKGAAWIKQVFTLAGGRPTPFEDLESEYGRLRQGAEVVIQADGCKVRCANPMGFVRFKNDKTACQCILMEYLEGFRRYADVRKLWGMPVRKELLKLLARWLDTAKIPNWDSVPTNLMVRGQPEAFEAVPIDLAIGLPFRKGWLAELERKM